MKLADVSVAKPVFTTVMMLVLLVFGAWSYSRVGVDLYPDVDVPVVTVTAVYPGADPATVETKVVEKLEEAINAVNGIDELRSTSAENVGIVVARFVLERDGDKAAQDVREKVAAVIAELPDEVEPPIVQKLDIGAAPIMSLVVSGPISTRDLTDLADDVIKQRLQTLQGVGNIDIVGGREREMQIRVDPMKLRAFGLAIEDVARTIGAQNVDIPGGRLNRGDREFLLKTQAPVVTAEELSEIVLTASGGRPVRLGDVAEVEDTEEEARSYAALDGEAAISLIVQKQSGANTVEVAEAVRAAVAGLQAELPEGVSIAIPVDNAVFIERSIHDVQFDLVFGAILAILIILFFLRDWRATLISALALPTSVIATIAFLNVMGFTFNTMTMLALTLSIGILIDDAIVVIENIHRHLLMGKTPMQAALDGTSEIGLAVLAITASIIAVFIPVATMQGIIGRFLFQFGLTVSFAVAISLFVAFTLTPMLSARMLHEEDEHHTSRVGQLIETMLQALEHAYRNLVRAALRHPIITGLIAIGSFVGALSLFTVIPFEFAPPEDRGEFIVHVELPSGTPLDQSVAYVDRMSEVIRELPGTELTFATIGGGTQGEVNRGSIHVEIVPASERSFPQRDAIAFFRGRLKPQFPDAEIAIEPVKAIGGGGSQRGGEVEYLLLGADFEELNQTADELIAALEQSEGYVDVDTNVSGAKPELSITIDRARAADLGVPLASVALAIRTLYAGETVTEIDTPQGRVEANLKAMDAFRRDPQRLLDLQVRSTTGQLVALGDIIELTPTSGPSQIERYNQQRQITILANLEGKALGTATTEIDALATEIVPDTVEAGVAGSADVLQDTIGYMVEALVLAILLIYLILAAQFESFVHPLSIMLSLPLSLIGALGALALFGMSLNLFGMIGFIMLMGLVTKNAVLLVDYTNVLRREGRELVEALVEAGAVRLRPILMTTAAMIFGMLPVALAMSAGGEVRAPMAVAIIGGLITSTLLTLVVVPVAYMVLERITDRLRRRPRPSTAGTAGEVA